MTDDETQRCIEAAIQEAKACTPSDPAETPKVGAIIAHGGKPLVGGHRTEDGNHAEKNALDELARKHAHVDTSTLTVFTTLEPCTHEVRSGVGKSCSELLIAARVKKVVVGLLDPNQWVCGRGVLRLQQSGIEVQLFPENNALQVRQLNRAFIQRQQTLGIKVDGSIHQTLARRSEWTKVEITGTLLNEPESGSLYSVVVADHIWWPNSPVSVDMTTKTWRCAVTLGRQKNYTVHIIKANALGKALINHYYKVGDLHKAWEGKLHRYPGAAASIGLELYPGIQHLEPCKGWESEVRIEIDLVDQ